MRTPNKPFPEYKWRWAVFTPTESLNSPPIFLGILRVLRRNEFSAFSSQQVNDQLRIVQQETNTTVNLVRSPQRNIFRNSGQYWKALGVLDPARPGQIALTRFGRKYADGAISQVEFASTTVKTLVLPNRKIETNLLQWDSIGLSIKPLELILEIIGTLAAKYGPQEGYLSSDELIDIVIPLAGDFGTLDEYLESIIDVRRGTLNVTTWPNCAPSSNDKRMAKEFLLFLENYGLCKSTYNSTTREKRFYLDSISLDEIRSLKSLSFTQTELDRIERIIRRTEIPSNIERKKVVREILDRPQQPNFRKNVLDAYRSTCLVTGARLENVLEAAHIKPAKNSGNDTIQNGLCLRVDIHRLFDSNHLRIKPTGKILITRKAKRPENYPHLPTRIKLPPFVDKDFLDWRMKYY